MSLEKEFVPYELAVKLKELGFEGLSICRYYYNESAKEWKIASDVEIDYLIDLYDVKIEIAPLWQQAFDFFMSNELYGEVYKTSCGYSYDVHYNDHKSVLVGSIHETYEEARYACLEKLIEIISCKSEN